MRIMGHNLKGGLCVFGESVEWEGKGRGKERGLDSEQDLSMYIYVYIHIYENSIIKST
jgi:hypothetical protein